MRQSEHHASDTLTGQRARDERHPEKGRKSFVCVSVPQQYGCGKILQNTYVSPLSQEHGIVKADDLFDKIQIGDMLVIIPVHSCLTADLMRKHVTTEGKPLQMMPKFL